MAPDSVEVAKCCLPTQTDYVMEIDTLWQLWRNLTAILDLVQRLVSVKHVH